MQNTFCARTSIFSFKKLLSVVALWAGWLKLQFNAMHAWKPSIVTCFYPIYYPDFSAHYFNSIIVLEATVWKTVKPSHQHFLPLKSCKWHLLLLWGPSHCQISRKKALGVASQGTSWGVQQELKCGTPWFENCSNSSSLAQRIKYKEKRASIGHNERSAEPQTDHMGSASSGSNFHSKRRAVNLGQPSGIRVL